MQEPDNTGARHQVHLRLVQGGQGVPRDPQRVGALQDGAQVADLLRRPGGPPVQQASRAHGDDDGGTACLTTFAGIVSRRESDVLAFVQRSDVDERLAQNRSQPLQLLRGHLAEPQALPVLDGQGQCMSQRPTVLIGSQQLLGAGELGELGHLGDVEARQVADPVDDRHRPQDLGV